MPKGAIHHIHTTAAPPVGTYMELTYEDIVYYNDREMMFKVFPKHKKLDGYLQCTKMREFSKDKEAYDQSLKNAILLTETQIRGKESHDIWKGFQPKFNLVNDLGKYYKFFKILLKSNLETCIR